MEDVFDRMDLVYDTLEGCEDVLKYQARHGIASLIILTKLSPECAAKAMPALRPHIEGKRVIEIGAGVGFMAIEMAKVAKSVIAFECDPAWSWIFTRSLYRHKPKNLTWIFGDASDFIGTITGEVSVVFTNSGVEEMAVLGAAFSPKLIMPLQDTLFTRQQFNYDPEKRILEREDELIAGFNGHSFSPKMRT